MLVCATIGHAGRPSRIGDRGAVRGEVEEVSLARGYADALDRELRRLGHTCILLSDGEYADQWARANAYGAGLYLALHVNAGGGNYGLLGYDHRSSTGPKVAAAIVQELGSLPWLTRAVSCSPGGTWGAMYATIRGVKAPALCVEPYFIDGPSAGLLPLLSPDIGRGLARGVDRWARA